jgi:2-dehydro-3-deoxygalactonokinase
MIGIDWGTTSLRAYRLSGGRVLERRDSAQGITAVAAGGFGAALQETVGDWLRDGERDVLMAGMVGSRQGWVEAPYLECPADFDVLALSLTGVPFAGARVAIVPGLRGVDASGTPEVMRGEETQLAGLVGRSELSCCACLPGTHSKWAHVAAGRVTNFRTHMTGEVFAALRGHTILGRMMQEGPNDTEAFLRGAVRAAEPGGLLHHLFGVRALTLAARLPETDAPAYLSGILVGHEVRSALAAHTGEVIQVIGAPELTGLYAKAIAACGGFAERHDGEAAALGLWRVGEHVVWA